MNVWFGKVLGSVGAVALLSSVLSAEVASVRRYDNAIEQQVAHKLAGKKQFTNVQAKVEDGIVTLTGTVDLYREKLEASKQAGKVAHTAGVRDLIEVAGPTVSDQQLQAKLSEKLWYDRMGYENLFNYFALGVQGGVVTIAGETYNQVARDSALATINQTPGVKDVIDNIRISPLSPFDDNVRRRAARAIYGDPVLSRYAIDPALPIRIIVDRGKIGLYGTVDNRMDKQIAGLRASQVFGAFSVENHLVVANSEKNA
ncbi:MAG: BON domain-containing protein [Acidobacteria bacterium]|nr:BON domain-containing protein [Acidobacteriota bacterium]